MPEKLLPSSRIVIGVPTFRRPKGLRRVLEGIARQKNIPCNIHVLVADNEGPEGAGTTVVRDMAAGYPFPLTVIPVAERGISQARNALMHEAFGKLGADALIMVDDDVWVEENWLAALVAMQQETGADVASGRVLPDFEEGEPEWAKGLEAYYWPEFDSGIAPTAIATTSVLFLKTVYACAQEHGAFNVVFSLTGGGDTEFFRRIKLHGIVFAFAPESVVHEIYGPTRVTRRWAMQRLFRHGSSHIRLLRIYPEGVAGSTVSQVVKICAGFAFGVLLSLAYPFSPSRGMKGMGLMSRQCGKICGLLEKYPEEYKITHGS